MNRPVFYGTPSSITASIMWGIGFSMDVSEKVRENRLRRIAARRRILLNKSRRRDPQAYDFGGFMLVDADTNAVIMGADPFPYSATLDDVEKWLK